MKRGDERRAQASAEIARLHHENGGATYSLDSGSQAGRRGYSVSIFPERSVIVPGRGIDSELAQDFISDNADLLADPRCCIGTWYDPDADETYLDISVLLTRKREAISLSRKYNQVGLFDLWRREYVPTGGTGRLPDEIPPEPDRLAALPNRSKEQE